MKIEAYKCDKCGVTMVDAEGFGFQGNVTFLSGGGLIGTGVGSGVGPGSVKEFHYCRSCTFEILSINPQGKIPRG